MSTATLIQPQPTALEPLLRHPGPSFFALIKLEVRKSVDTRAGRWIIFSIIGLAVAVLAWQVWKSRNSAVALKDFLDAAQTPVVLIIPVLGVLAMTSEWSQRSALTTFTLLPRRLPVLLAKVVAALVIATSAVIVIGGVAVLATALAGLVSGESVAWSLTAKEAGGLVLANLLNVAMGAGFGAIMPVTGVALTSFFVAPTLFALLSATVLKERGEWLDVTSAFGRIIEFDLAGKGPQTSVALLVWVIAPLVLGIWVSNRREVK
jgi:hypothetical protein